MYSWNQCHDIGMYCIVTFRVLHLGISLTSIFLPTSSVFATKLKL